MGSLKGRVEQGCPPPWQCPALPLKSPGKRSGAVPPAGSRQGGLQAKFAQVGCAPATGDKLATLGLTVFEKSTSPWEQEGHMLRTREGGGAAVRWRQSSEAARGRVVRRQCSCAASMAVQAVRNWCPIFGHSLDNLDNVPLPRRGPFGAPRPDAPPAAAVKLQGGGGAGAGGG